jgi:pre-mRNA-splicing factor ATP-dependent RNA helicase DHX15/PRP43
MSTSVSNINPYNNKPFTANYERIQRSIQSLPVFPKLPQFAAILVNECDVLILIGETGAGKTAQVPKYIFEKTGLLSDLKLALTQNRRLAANAVSHSYLSILLDPTVLITC